MSAAEIRSALETALDSISPAIATAWENVPYTPSVGTPYQQAFLLRASPDNPEIGPGFVERGILQTNLCYPKDGGPAAAEARAELIRAKFPYGASFVSGGITVNIIATPEIAPARAEDDHFFLPVKVRWSAQIRGG